MRERPSGPGRLFGLAHEHQRTHRLLGGRSLSKPMEQERDCERCEAGQEARGKQAHGCRARKRR